MRKALCTFACLALTTARLWGLDTSSSPWQVHQKPDADGVYYAGPEVSAPKMVSTFSVPYPSDSHGKDIQGMTVFAMVIDANGNPEHIELLHRHGDGFDQAALAAVKHSKFEPGMLAGKPVPVWIDVRVVFHANRSQALPQVLIAERDLPPPDESKVEDKHHNPLSHTPPFAIHTVDADFADPFAQHPWVQVALVDVLVSEDGSPKEVHVRRGLGFGLDEKAAAAVWHYRFIPATQRGTPITARCSVMVSFAEF